MKHKFYLEQKLYPDHVLARILYDSDAKALHYKDGYRSEGENYTVLVIGFESEEEAKNYIAAMKNCFLIDGYQHAPDAGYHTAHYKFKKGAKTYEPDARETEGGGHGMAEADGHPGGCPPEI